MDVERCWSNDWREKNVVHRKQILRRLPEVLRNEKAI
jgi:hypothetical protein